MLWIISRASEWRPQNIEKWNNERMWTINQEYNIENGLYNIKSGTPLNLKWGQINIWKGWTTLEWLTGFFYNQ